MFERNIHTYTIKEQLRLHRSSVAVIGMGGGGCAVAEILARVGVGKLVLIDGDRFEDSNRNRQIGALASTIGEYKAQYMANRLKDVSVYCEASFFNEFLTERNLYETLAAADIVCDTVDGRNNKILVGRRCKELNKTYVTGGLGGYAFWSATLMEKSIWDICRGDTPERIVQPCASAVFAQAALQAQLIVNGLLDRDWGTVDRIVKVNLKTFTTSVEEIE